MKEEKLADAKNQLGNMIYNTVAISKNLVTHFQKMTMRFKMPWMMQKMRWNHPI